MCVQSKAELPSRSINSNFPEQWTLRVQINTLAGLNKQLKIKKLTVSYRVSPVYKNKTRIKNEINN